MEGHRCRRKGRQVLPMDSAFNLTETLTPPYNLPMTTMYYSDGDQLMLTITALSTISPACARVE